MASADADGVAEIDFTVSGYSLMDDMAVAGRTLVVHSTTDRIACGLIIPTTAQIARIGTYPGYDGAKSPKGLLALNMTNASMIGIVGTVVGLGADRPRSNETATGD